jgi:hypothetical protein
MGAESNPSRGAVYERLLEFCPPYRFASPWDFLTPDADCRGPVHDPAAALSDLQARFNAAALEGAGVLERLPSGQVRLVPALCTPVGAVVALRRGLGEPPFALLTARGCLPRGTLPALAALEDAWTAARLAEAGALCATSRIWDVVLLRALGFPATLATGLHRASLPQLQALDEAFAEQEPFGGASLSPPPPPTGEAGDERPGESADPGDRAATAGGDAPQAATPPRPRLALVGWTPGSVRAEVPPPLRCAAAALVGVRQHLALPLAGVSVWLPSPKDLDSLRFQLRFRDASLISDMLRQSMDVLDAFEGVAAPQEGRRTRTAAPADLGAAQIELLARLADARGQGRTSDRVPAARRTYEDLIECQLIAPLQTWALTHDDPVIRNMGYDLATVCRELHRMGPQLHELLARRREKALAGTNDPMTDKVLKEYLQLSKRLGSIARDLHRLKEGI